MKKILNTLALFILLFANTFAQENILFRDDFNDNTYKWNYDPNRQLNAFIKDSSLYINNLSSIEAPARYVRNLFLCKDSNFIIESKLQFLDKGEEANAGLIWHSEDENNGFYFQITSNGKVRIWGNKFNRKMNFLPWTSFPSFENSEWYKMRIHKIGNTLNFYVNNTKVYTSPFRGQFGVEMGFAIGKFTNIRIDYIGVQHALIKETNKKIADKLSDDDLFWLIKEEKYKAQLSILGKLIDLNTGGKIKDAAIFIIDTLGNELSTVKSDTSGFYSIQTKFTDKIIVKVKADGYLSNAAEFLFSTDDESFERKKDFHLQQLEIGKLMSLKNVLFAQGSAKLLSESFFELDKLIEMMKENLGIEIELSGHTDNSGRADINLQLSGNRVNSVIRYLIDGGIDESRLTGKGYGGEFPIANNDSDLTRKLNRRVEFKIIKK